MIFELALGISLIIILISFIAEYIDSTFGMGYGTLLTPILLIMGFEPLAVVPSILLSELVTGLLAGFSHHHAGNVDFKPKSTNIGHIIRKLKELGIMESARRGLPKALKIAIILSFCSAIGTVAAVYLAINISKYFLKIYIAILITLIGAYILITKNKQLKISKLKIIVLGIIASFNKGLSGGGYGPVVAGGQIISGVDPKNAIGITSLSEAITCIVGVILYFITKSNVQWTLAPYLLIGSALSVPLSAYSVKHMKTKRLILIMGILVTLLGLFNLYKAFFG